MALEPITRQEKIIAGQDLTPITRMEKFLKQFGGGGDGLPTGGAHYQQLVTDGDGNAKWEDRMVYETDPVLTEIIPQTTVTFSNLAGVMGAVWPESFDLVDGQTYKILWDGTDYVCTGILFNGAAPALGNLSILGFGDDTGEPFIFINQGQWAVASTESATEHIISISESVAEVVKIPEKYVNQHTHILEYDFWTKRSESELIDIVNQFNAGDVFVYQNDSSSCVLLLYASYIKTQGFKFAYMDGFTIRMISGNGGNWTTKYSEIAFS